MKKFLALFLCAAFLILSIPGLAQAADNQAKSDFIANYTALLQKSTQMQESMYKDMKTNTITLTMSGQLTDTQLVTNSTFAVDLTRKLCSNTKG